MVCVCGEGRGTSVRVNMSTLSDSGFEEDLHSPSPAHQHCTRTERSRASQTSHARAAECWLQGDYDESCFRVQRNNEEDFLALDCLAHQSQVEVCSPRIKQLLSLCCDAFSREQLCNLECLILLRLNFRLAAPTPAFFLDYFISREESRYVKGTEEKTSAEENKCRHRKTSEEQLFHVKRYKCLAGKVCELSLADYAFNKYRPSVIAQSALSLAKDLLRRKESSVKHSSSLEVLDMCCVDDDGSQGLDNHTLIQQCTHELQLLVSLNEESVQDLLTV